MKKILLITILSLLTTLSFGIDFGGNLEDSTYFQYSDSSNLYHADTLSLWLTTGLWEDTNLFMQGSYTYTTDNPWIFDLDYLRIENKGASFINYTFGRFYTSDFSGFIFSNKIDGASAAFNFPRFIISTKAGYTGLLSTNSSTIIMTLTDQNDSDDSTVFFASPRIVGGIEVLFPDLFLHQDLKAGIWAQIDMRNESDVTEEGTTTPSSTGGKMDTQYFGVALSGSLTSSLYYDTFTWLGTGRTLSYIDNSSYTYKSIISFLGSAGLRYYREDLLYSRIAFRFLYSSGDADYLSSFIEGNTSGNATNFITISGQSMALIFSPKLGNIFFTKFSYSLKPFSGKDNRILRNIQLELTDVNFFRSTKGQISESGINPESTSLYLGTEIDGTINFRPFSDFGLSLSGGVFIPSNGADGAFLDSRDVEFLGRLGLSFSF